MKGTSATLGALPLAERCAQLEHRIQAAGAEDAAACIAAIERAWGVVERALRSEMAG